MKVVVTGGAGFIGSHLVARLLDLGARVLIIDDFSSGDPNRIDSRAEVVRGSVLDPTLLSRCLKDTDACYHLAAIASVQLCQENIAQSHAVNATGFVNVLETLMSAAPRSKLVYASSAAVYGNPIQLPLSTEARPVPISAYGVDKLSCELHANAAWTCSRFPSVGLRFFNVYGSGQNPASPYSGVISRFVDSAAKHGMVQIFGDGAQTRDFIAVTDIVDVLVGLASRDFQKAHVHNVCTGIATSLVQLAAAIGDAMSLQVGITHLPSREGDIRASLGDPSGLEREFGLRPNTSLHEGLHLLLRGGI